MNLSEKIPGHKTRFAAAYPPLYNINIHVHFVITHIYFFSRLRGLTQIVF